MMSSSMRLRSSRCRRRSSRSPLTGGAMKRCRISSSSFSSSSYAAIAACCRRHHTPSPSPPSVPAATSAARRPPRPAAAQGGAEPSARRPAAAVRTRAGGPRTARATPRSSCAAAAMTGTSAALAAGRSGGRAGAGPGAGRPARSLNYCLYTEVDVFVQERSCRPSAAGRCKSSVTLPGGRPRGRLHPALGWRRAARPVWVLRPGEASAEAALGRRGPPVGRGAAVRAPLKHFCVVVSNNPVLSVQPRETAESLNEKDLCRAGHGCNHSVAAVACFCCSVLEAQVLYRPRFLG